MNHRHNPNITNYPLGFCFRYIQVGNAVAVPVSRALGYTLGLAYQGRTNNEPLFKLPPKFPDFLERLSSTSSENDS